MSLSGDVTFCWRHFLEVLFFALSFLGFFEMWGFLVKKQGFFTKK